MNTPKQLGIWMDHSVANLIDIKAKEKSQTILSEFTSDTKEEALEKVKV